MGDVLNSNVKASNSFDSVSVEGQDFGTPLYLAAPGSLGVGFTESVRYYSNAQEVAADLASGDITQAAADALNTGLEQTLRTGQVALGQVPGAVSKVTEVTVGGTVTVGDAFTIDLTSATQLAYVALASPTAATVIAGLIASAVSEDYDRFTVEAGSSTDKLLITDKIKGLDQVIAVAVTGVGTIVAAVVTPVVEPGEASSVEITAAGAADDIWTLTIGEKVFTYIELLADSVISIAQALKALVALDSDFQAVDETAVDDDTIIIAPFSGSPPFSAFSLSSSGAGTNTIVELQEAAAIATLMDVLFLADDTWYGLASEVKTQGMMLDLASWSNTNKRVFLTQESDPGLLTAEAASTGAIIDALNYPYVATNYHASDSEEMAFAWLSSWLATDPDQDTTTAAYKTLVGITASTTITTTQRAALESTGTGFVGRLRGQSATWKGVTADGNLLSTRVSRDWLDSRIQERVAAAILAASNRGSKIPFTDAGIQSLAGLVRSFLFDQAIRVGHIAKVLDSSGKTVSPIVQAPLRSQVPQDDIDNNRIVIPYWATIAGEILEFEAIGYLSL